jgi:hypothetical protein
MPEIVEGLKKLPRAGLCGTCQHARLIESDKGSVFVRCELSRVDANFAKYPCLPVVACSGFESKEVDSSLERASSLKDQASDPKAG